MPGHFLEDSSQNIAGDCRSNHTKRDSTQALVVVNEISTLSDRSNREIVGFHKSHKATGRLVLLAPCRRNGLDFRNYCSTPQQHFFFFSTQKGKKAGKKSTTPNPNGIWVYTCDTTVHSKIVLCRNTPLKKKRILTP